MDGGHSLASDPLLASADITQRHLVAAVTKMDALDRTRDVRLKIAPAEAHRNAVSSLRLEGYIAEVRAREACGRAPLCGW